MPLLRCLSHVTAIFLLHEIEIPKKSFDFVLCRKVDRHSLPGPQKSVLFDLYALTIKPAFGRFQGDEQMSSRPELAVDGLHQIFHSAKRRVVNDVVRDHQIEETVRIRDLSHILLDNYSG